VYHLEKQATAGEDAAFIGKGSPLEDEDERDLSGKQYANCFTASKQNSQSGCLAEAD
jgi:hypothetical protein